MAALEETSPRLHVLKPTRFSADEQVARTHSHWAVLRAKGIL